MPHFSQLMVRHPAPYFSVLGGLTGFEASAGCTSPARTPARTKSAASASNANRCSSGSHAIP
jgi:hypothetical protein